jgi:GMP synthase-like glutamine amidotransferase
MRIHYLQHVPFEGLAFISQWIKGKDYPLTSTALFNDDLLPELSDFDLLIILGGPMGVFDTSAYPWLNREKRFIRRSLREKKQVLGICLGAQLIAEALGAKVYPNPYKEIGWYKVGRVETASGTIQEGMLPQEFFAFHWHGDTFDLPTGAVHLARSEACRHQAFFFPPCAIGLQFHLESSQESIEALIHNCGNELSSAPYIQNMNQIHEKQSLIEISNEIMLNILNFFENHH